MKGQEVSALQKQWLENEENKRRGEAPGEVRRQKRALSAALAGDVPQGEPRSSAKKSKKEEREMFNNAALGGMRNPDLAVDRLHMVRQVGATWRLEWETFSGKYPGVADVASKYGTKVAQLDQELVRRWRDQMMYGLDGPVEMEGMTLRPNSEYKSPLCAEGARGR